MDTYEMSPEDDSSFDSPKKMRKSAQGRRLIRWNPEVDQLVLLCVDHVCAKTGITIPWDDVAKEVQGYLTGEAIKQHLVKLHKARVEAGQKVPEKLDKATRRKAMLANAAAIPSGRSKNIKSEESDEVPAKQESTLLYHDPKKNKKTKTPKKNATSSDTPSSGRGNIARTGIVGREGGDDEDEDGLNSDPKTTSTGKRNRKSNGDQKVKDDLDSGSPLKKPKLRSLATLNYSEQIDEEDENDSLGVKHRDEEYMADDQKEAEQSSGTFSPAVMPRHSTPAPTDPNYTFAPPPNYFGSQTSGAGQSIVANARVYGNHQTTMSSQPRTFSRIESINSDGPAPSRGNVKSFHKTQSTEIPVRTKNADFSPVATKCLRAIDDEGFYKLAPDVQANVLVVRQKYNIPPPPGFDYSGKVEQNSLEIDRVSNVPQSDDTRTINPALLSSSISTGMIPIMNNTGLNGGAHANMTGAFANGLPNVYNPPFTKIAQLDLRHNAAAVTNSMAHFNLQPSQLAQSGSFDSSDSEYDSAYLNLFDSMIHDHQDSDDPELSGI